MCCLLGCPSGYLGAKAGPGGAIAPNYRGFGRAAWRPTPPHRKGCSFASPWLPSRPPKGIRNCLTGVVPLPLAPMARRYHLRAGSHRKGRRLQQPNPIQQGGAHSSGAVASEVETESRNFLMKACHFDAALSCRKRQRIAR